MLVIDGSLGEGGGQIVRSALSLSLIAQIPIRITNIRAGRRRSGLLRQHLTAVKACRDIGAAEVKGARLHSKELEFWPKTICNGTFHFAVSTAGSACLVLQTVLPALLCAPGPSKVAFEGGTHNDFAPPYDYLERVFLPLLTTMGVNASLRLERTGFFPAGGGRIWLEVEPCASLKPLALSDPVKVVSRKATALLSQLPRHIASRELATVAQKLRWRPQELHLREIKDSPGPGNVLLLEVDFGSHREMTVGFGRLGRPAEEVATTAAREMQNLLKSEVPVGAHLADQLLLPMAMAGSGTFLTGSLTPHSTTNMAVIKRFLPVRFNTQVQRGRTTVRVERSVDH